MTQQELLLALKDISPPAAPPWWLPGDGQLVLAVLLGLVLVLGWFVRQRRRTRLSLTLAQRELARIRDEFERDRDSRRLSRELSRWLKQVAMLAYPRRQIAAACGEDWLRFLDQSIGSSRFTRGCGRAFGGAVYRQNPEIDGAGLLRLCEQWLAAIQPRLLQKRRG